MIRQNMNSNATHTIEHNGVTYRMDQQLAKYTGQPRGGDILQQGDIVVCDGSRVTYVLTNGEFVPLEPALAINSVHRQWLDTDDRYWEIIPVEYIPTRLIRTNLGDYYWVKIVSCAINYTRYYGLKLGVGMGRWLAPSDVEFVTDLSTIADEELMDILVELLDE